MPVAPASLSDLFDWRNANGAKIVRTDGGRIGLRPAPPPGSPLALAVLANQSTLAALAPQATAEPDATATPGEETTATPDDAGEETLSDGEFSAWAEEMRTNAAAADDAFLAKFAAAGEGVTR